MGILSKSNAIEDTRLQQKPTVEIVRYGLFLMRLFTCLAFLRRPGLWGLLLQRV